MRSRTVLLAAALGAASCGETATPPRVLPSASPSASPSARTGAEGWTMLAGSPESPANARHDDIFFLDASRGFPTLFATADGGATWTPLEFGTRVNRMRVVSPDLVYASGDRVYRWTP